MKVHIPFKGSLAREVCVRSYDKARELFPKCFPEYSSTGFTVNTWMLAPELDQILKENSNIRAFQQMYHRFPLRSSGRDIFEYVFQTPVTDVSQVDIESLPENSSLQRDVKDMLRKGVVFHEFGGFIPW